MSEIPKGWIEGQTGPREILPESLWTGITRETLTVSGWQQQLKRAQSEFNTSQAGVWLPSDTDSETDFRRIRTEVARSARDLLVEDDLHESLADVIGRVTLTDTGCWETDSNAAVADLATLDSKYNNKVLEGEEHLDLVQRCDTANCVYHRHYDLTFSVPSGRRLLLYPNTRLFRADKDGSVLTAWGDRLPSVDQSREALRDFQRRFVPYVKPAEAPLSAYNISLISLLPTTGCWFANNYFMADPNDPSPPKNWQYDAYSRLAIPKIFKDAYPELTSYAKLGHRVTWRLTHNDMPNRINHRCGFRPCVNPGHLEPITGRGNSLHANMMITAKDMVTGRTSFEGGIMRLEAYADALGMDRQPIEQFWAAELTALDNYAARA